MVKFFLLLIFIPSSYLLSYYSSKLSNILFFSQNDYLHFIKQLNLLIENKLDERVSKRTYVMFLKENEELLPHVNATIYFTKINSFDRLG